MSAPAESDGNLVVVVDDEEPSQKRRRTDLTRNPNAQNTKLWEHFFIFKDKTKHELGVCDVEECGAEINYGKKHSTSKLTQHLEHRHKDLWKTLQEPVIGVKSKSICSFLASSSDLSFPDALLRWIVSTYQPLSTVEHPAFRALCVSLNPRVQHISRSALTRSIAEKTAILKTKLTAYLKGQYFSVTTDAWTSAANQSYYAYTLHFIDDSWTLRAITLDCKYHMGQSKAENVIEDIQRSLSEYSLDRKNLVCVVTDTEATMVKVGKFFFCF